MKADGEDTRQSSYNPNLCVGLVDIVPSGDSLQVPSGNSLHSSRTSVQALRRAAVGRRQHPPSRLGGALRGSSCPLGEGMTSTKQHAPRGTAGRGPNWDSDHGPCAGHAGAAWRCTKRHRRLWAKPGLWAVHGPRRRELRVDACTSRQRRPRDPLAIAGRERAGGAARLGAGATRCRMHISAPPAARPFGDRGPGPRAGRRSWWS
jgi:hypothetical protein